jgi:KipI family sensor histidine kinase inhibitor
MTILPLGDSAVVIDLGETIGPAIAARARAVAGCIERQRLPWVVDVVSAFASVAVHCDLMKAPEFEAMRLELEQLATAAAGDASVEEGRTFVVPVVYGGEAGPDLAEVAQRAGLSPTEVIACHAGATYDVRAIGFAPGFPYLGGLPPELAVSRRATPRARVPAGSVGIGGAQTGIYPRESPGGWNLIGRTPLALFDPHRAEPALLRAGDRLRFQAVAAADFSGSAPPVPVQGAAVGPAAVLEIVRPGVFTTIQDLGRPGHRAHGVPRGGAMDPFALRVANLLVGNTEAAAAIEFTLVGPELLFVREAHVAIAGVEVEGLPVGRPFALRAGDTLDLRRFMRGTRGYLAVAGGIDVPLVLGSRGTDVRGGFGGHAGRVLQAGDHLCAPVAHVTLGGHWHIDPRIFPDSAPPVELRVVSGTHAGEFGPEWTAQVFKVSPQSDRMGVRLNGNPLVRRTGRELLSAPVAPGTVQVPADGQPIVLLADAQTIGGYPRLAHVITADLGRAAQLAPGDTVRFTPVSLDEARHHARAREHTLDLLRAGLAQKLH